MTQLEDRLRAHGDRSLRQRPHAVRRALRELDEVAQASERVLAGMSGASHALQHLLARDQSNLAEEHTPQGANRGFAAVFDYPCADRLASAIRVLQAAFAMDFSELNPDPAWTGLARSFVMRRTFMLTRYREGLTGLLGRMAAEANPADRFPGPEPDPNLPVDPDLPGPPGGIGDETSSLLPGLGDEGDPYLRSEELCLGLYQDLAAATLADPLIDVIGAVEPDCLCHTFDPDRVFAALPRRGEQFPHPLPPEVRLFFGVQDITTRIVRTDTRRIEFRLPRSPHTATLRLRTLTAELRDRYQNLERVCGDLLPSLPEGGAPGRAPGARIHIVYPPMLERVWVEGPTAGRIEELDEGLRVDVEACVPIRICWRARLADQLTAPQGSCPSIAVTVTDARKTVLTTGGTTGCFTAADPGGRTFIVTAVSYAGKARCAAGRTTRLLVRRFARVGIRLVSPGSEEIHGGDQGILGLRISCPAPASGLSVELTARPQGMIGLPDSVHFPAGESEAVVAFTALPRALGTVVITARARRHRPGSFELSITGLRALCLSGGGAKGSFQAGAIQYFAIHRWDDVEPDIVVGTSVGAINALGVAEGRPPGAPGPDGIERLKRVWLSLRVEEDMFVESEWLRTIKTLAPDNLSFQEFAKPEAIVPGVLLGGITGGLLGFLAGAGAEAADKIETLVAQFEQMRFLYSLEPTRQKIRDNVRFNRILNSGKKLRLASVALEDGEVYYTTEQGQIIAGHARFPSFVGVESLGGGQTLPPFASYRDRVINGAMASAGIPAVFPYRRLTAVADGTTRQLTLVDGGVREVLPIRAAQELGARFIIAVSASPNRLSVPYHSTLTGEEIVNFGNEKVVNVALRAVDISVQEVSRGEVTPDGGYCDDVDRLFVIPSFLVHGTQEIDPGLILINMAYGYLRAFEVYAHYREAVNALQLLLMTAVSDEISRLRRRIWELEEKVAEVIDEVRGVRLVSVLTTDIVAGYPATARLFNGGILREIRLLKQEVLDLVVGRVRSHGPESVPIDFSDPSTGYLNPVVDWWDNWERHKEPLESFLRSFDPWNALPIGVRFVTVNELGSREQVFEGQAPSRPAVPPDVRAALGI